MKLTLSAVSMGVAAVAMTSLVCLAADNKPEGKKKILFYSASFGFRHSVVTRPLTGEMAYAEKILKEVGEKAGYEVFVTQDFNDLEFAKYDAIVLYTTGSPLFTGPKREGFLKWLRKGGALIGIHTATDSFHNNLKEDNVPMDGDTKATVLIPDWPEYIRIIGAAFKGHKDQAPTLVKINDPNHPATKGIEAGWTITDEIYQFDRFNKDVHLLLSADTDKMDDDTLKKLGMKKGEFHPIAWTNTEGKGRVFYTSLGHREDVWTNPTWQKHLLGGIAWALRQTDK
jgi:hypothetical protein